MNDSELLLFHERGAYIKDLTRQLAERDATIAELREGLRKHGYHIQGCLHNLHGNPCTCGLAKLIGGGE